MSFLDVIAKQVEKKKEASHKNKPKFYAEANLGTEELDAMFEPFEDEVTNPDETNEEEDLNTDYEDMSELDVGDNGEGEIDDGEIDFNNEENNEDAYNEEQDEDYYGEEDNLFTNGEDENSSVFRRKVRMLNLAFTNLYNKYNEVVNKLSERDLAGDKAVVVNSYLAQYKNALNALAEYIADNDDTFVVRFQTFVEFRAYFISINNKINSIEKDVHILS